MNNRSNNYGPDMQVGNSFLIPYSSLKQQESEGNKASKQINETSLMSPVGMNSQGKENKLFNLVFE